MNSMNLKNCNDLMFDVGLCGWRELTFLTEIEKWRWAMRFCFHWIGQWDCLVGSVSCQGRWLFRIRIDNQGDFSVVIMRIFLRFHICNQMQFSGTRLVFEFGWKLNMYARTCKSIIIILHICNLIALWST